MSMLHSVRNLAGRTLIVSLLALAIPAVALAQAAKPSTTDDETQIRASAEAYEKAYAAADAKALAAMFAKDGELIDPSGRTFKGRDEIEQEFKAIFQQHANAQVDAKIESIKFISPDVALETGTAQATAETAPAAVGVKYTALWVKRDGNWSLLNVDESSLSASEAGGKLAALDFLAGDWQAKLDGDKTYELHCEWMPGKRFLKRTFQVTVGGKPSTSGLQVIGFDPALGQIVSWTFDSEGGFGHEVWEPRSGGWRIAASSVLADGATSLSTNLLTKGGPDSFTWQSTERSLNDQLLPDTAPVRVQRTGK